MTTTTAIEVREVDYASVRGDLIDVLQQTRTFTVETERFDWMYQQNPDGPAVVWVIESPTDRVAGFTACLPRRMRVEGEQLTCWNGADFSILPKYRTLGPSLKLRRAARTAIEDGRADFLYSHPNERMANIHHRVGHRPIGAMRRIAKPLQFAPFVESRLGKLAARITATTVDPVVRRLGNRRAASPVEYLEDAEFDERFDRLFERCADQYAIIGVRDATYLNWRYTANPVSTFDVITLNDGSELAGYLVLTCDDEQMHIKDVFPATADVIRPLGLAAVAAAHRRGLRSVSFIGLESNPVLSELAGLGFRDRPGTSEMYGFAPESSSLASKLHDASSWYVSVGDRDI